MRVAVMQPYFFPYIGYFQLMDSVDCFVFFDDVQYIDRGWVNRNRLLSNGQPIWWSWPVQRDSRDRPIMARRYAASPQDKAAARARLASLYRKAPCFVEVMPWLERCLAFEGDGVAAFNQHLLTTLAAPLGIRCQWACSSWWPSAARRQDRILELCGLLGASDYVNSAGGAELYRAADFAASGVRLHFLQACEISYAQGTHAHVPWLSIVDVLMFNGFEGTTGLLSRCRLRAAQEP